MNKFTKSIGMGVSAIALLIAVTLPASSATNTLQLSNGNGCAINLQIGSDKTASKSASPVFRLGADAPLASYTTSIDGNPNGTFNANQFSIACITTATPLTDGPHVLQVSEGSPTPGPLAPFNFTVDTIAPPAPSTPVLAPWSDDPGSGTSRYSDVTLTGTAVGANSVAIYDGSPAVLIGGSIVQAGTYSARTITLTNGLHSIKAVSVDTAGNRSVDSGTFLLTIDTTLPASTTTSSTTTSTTTTSTTTTSTTVPTPTTVCHGNGRGNSCH